MNDDRMAWYTWLWMIPFCFIVTVIDVAIEIVYDICGVFKRATK
jgi:hypothetical protein